MIVRLMLFFAAVFAAHAQSTSTITGIVTDQSNAIVPRASVVVTATETGVEHRIETNSDGYYTVPSLPVGDYTVSAEFQGFRRAISSAFKLDAGSTARVDLTLFPADSKQGVEVAAFTAGIDVDQGMVGSTISQKELADLPLDGRSSMNMVATIAGVNGEVGPVDQPPASAAPMIPGTGLSIGGGRLSSTAYLTDGAHTTSIGIGRVTVAMSADTVEEMRVLTSTFSARYGSVGSGVVSTITKSGTNDLRGSAFWFQRNPAWEARTFNESVPPTDRRIDSGVVVGGPVVLPKVYNGRNRTFFFASFEPKQYTTGYQVLERVPTAEERTGDFRNSWVAAGQTRPLLYQQVECSPSPANCQQLMPLNRASAATLYPLFSANDPDPSKRGYVIPKQYLSPIVQSLLAKVPMPNMPYDVNGANFVGTRGVIGRNKTWTVKIDELPNASQRLTARYTTIPLRSDNYYVLKSPEPWSVPNSRSASDQAFLGYTYTITPRIVNELRVSYLGGTYGAGAAYDIQTKNYTRDVYGLPSATSWGYPAFFLRGNGWGKYGSNLPQSFSIQREHQYQLSDELMATLGAHSLAFGFDTRRMQQNLSSGSIGNVCCGIYNFQVTPTNSGNANAPGGLGGDGFAAFLLGLPTSVTATAAEVPYYYRWKAYATFVQDDWKAARNLTLNLGLRWRYESPRAEKFNRQANLDLDHLVPLQNANGQNTGYTFNYLYAGVDGRSQYLLPVHKMDFEPRFGFAWQLPFAWARQRSMVFRGGYGISHLPNTGLSATPTPDFGTGAAGAFGYRQWTGNTPAPTTQSQVPGAPVRVSSNPPVTILDPRIFTIPADGKLCAGCTPADPRVPAGNAIGFVSSNASPYIQTWNVSTQVKVAGGFVLSLSYLGTKGTHLYSPKINFNNPDREKYAAMLDAGQDPTAAITDPFGRVDASGKPLAIAAQDLLRPYPTLGTIYEAGITNSNSIYHAGIVELDRRFRGNVGLRFNYTWSKSIDDTSDSSLDAVRTGLYGASTYQNAPDLKANRSVSLFDNRHRFNLVGNYQLPFGKGQTLLGQSRLTDLVLGGWSINGMAGLYSGWPFAFRLGDGNGVPGVGTTATEQEAIRPNIVPRVPLINPRWNKSVANDVPYANPEAFARPAFGQLGNAARTLDYARWPWRNTFNASLSRSFFPFENRRRYLQFRGEVYNVLNTVYFSPNPGTSNELFASAPPVTRTGLSLAGPIPYFPGTTAGSFPAGSRAAILGQYYSSTFGMFNRANNSSPRRIQLALKIYF